MLLLGAWGAGPRHLRSGSVAIYNTFELENECGRGQGQRITMWTKYATTTQITTNTHIDVDNMCKHVVNNTKCAQRCEQH